ncbi:FMP41 (YNL168C) [Zygosaccharomyces parabailii]|uniref:oxaloacetate tautomerase n=1 Tax=Zygosaccharomyces bailii (strain CLIB 213 / ATCC 58445 / CBS 680 / BCRC 21525 / NBRC 1098 / NCYC 1416 / NRRL Y-2227) TaxID=1333698 RepID=A0A8J2T614_ZYGB2|nr:FMP41 (YNL168C) [Zygosaccharomyces parabailii]CDF88649.1 BN860_15170g1_1 [Zygosaccharomyces bailii CLIB 213]CDH14476.1 probable FMP41-Found in Mitochondrial Proteome [Zygosaccharomyces bailii ISA1307]
MSFAYLKNARKIICIGRNYAAHIKELNNATPKQPFFFLKPTSSLITPIDQEHVRKQMPTNFSYHGLNEDGTNPSPILVPKGVIIHHEVELALVMDKYVSNVSPGEFGPEDVYHAIRGFSLALDLTARNVQDEAKKKGLPWSIGKGFDTFCPISHFIPKEQLKKDKQNLQDVFRLTCSVNGIKRQDGTSDLMLNSLHKIIQHISTMITLEPGDIVLTGTPAGVGELHPGDEVKAELYCREEKLVYMSFGCEARPGPYIYKET